MFHEMPVKFAKLRRKVGKRGASFNGEKVVSESVKGGGKAVRPPGCLAQHEG
jgi:hypothetical protein